MPQLFFVTLLILGNYYCYLLQNQSDIKKDYRYLSKIEEVPWGVKSFDSSRMWAQGLTGRNIKVAILDTGIDLEHKDLINNIHKGFNVINPKMKPQDDNGHGTLVAGVISATHNKLGITGVAPEASIYPVKVLDRFGKGKIQNVITGIEWCIKNNIQIINMSFSLVNENSELHEAIQKALNKGIVIVASANNSDKNFSGYPAAYAGVISVTSINEKGDLDESSSARKVDFAAPGVNILSTKLHGGYGVSDGNSLAAPHITGILALLKNKEPSLSFNELIQEFGLFYKESNGNQIKIIKIR